MRAAVILASVILIAFAGCVEDSDPNSIDGQSVSVSVSYSKQTNNSGTTVNAQLTGTSGLAGWDELTVTGCSAPTSGPFDLPHQFSGCSETAPLRILEKATGNQLYSSQ